MSTDGEDPFAHWPARTPLYDGDQLALVFTLEEMLRSGRPWADVAWRPPDVRPDRAAEVALSALGGYAFSTTDPALVEALSARGATELRHAHTMTHALDPVPDVATPDGADISLLTREALEADADELGALNVAAYPPDHPDHEHADAASAAGEMRAFAAGKILGPFLDVSSVARIDGRFAGACIVVDREGAPPDGGAWIVDVFRDPALAVKGLGAALIATTLAASRDTGLSGVGLAVTHANATALSVYRKLGFVETVEAWTLALPGAA
ncbi:MAG TPA: GNAT family N-acetyltransferase [Nocardioidaceae bacterium]|nr:GNAT family N-acetyltransferase [Nocardioidaceae bacterium]